jgi:hypothetical protein
MRNARDRCIISGGPTTWNDVPCTFAFLDALKSEALFGAQESKGSLLIPLYVRIPEGGKVLDDYRVILTSPQHPRIDQPMLIDSIRWNRIHQVLTLSIPNVA